MSRTDARSDSLRRRPTRTVPAVIVAVLLLAAGVGLVWAAVLRLSTGAWPQAAARTGSWLTALSWGTPLLLTVTLVVGAVGLILLIAAVKPGAPSALRLEPAPSTTAASTEAVMTRSSVAKLSTARARAVDAVDGARATVSAHRVIVTVRTPSADRANVEEQVQRQIAAALHAAGLDPAPTVKVTARTHQL